MGEFSPKFSMIPIGQTVDGTQKSLEGEMMARRPTTSIIMQNLVEIERRTSVEPPSAADIRISRRISVRRKSTEKIRLAEISAEYV